MFARSLALILAVACSSPSSDSSLPPERFHASDYTDMGVPTPERAWTVDDYEQAAKALVAKIPEGDRARLPRIGGAQSGALFARLVERGTSADIVADVKAGFIAHGRRFEAINAISKLYMLEPLAPPMPEYLALAGVMLHEAAILDEHGDAFVASFGPDDPKREVRLGGLQKMRTGWGEIVRGGLGVLADRRVPEVARVGLAGDLAASMPVVVPRLDGPTQQALRAQLAKVRDVLEPGPVRDALPAKI